MGTVTEGDFIGYVQQISVSRANRWHGGDFRQWSGLEWAGAMCGEAGEAANVAKKLRRVELEIDGNAASERALVPSELVEKLGRECADVFLYLVLLAARYDIDLTAAIVETFNAKSREMGFPELLEEPSPPAPEEPLGEHDAEGWEARKRRIVESATYKFFKCDEAAS